MCNNKANLISLFCLIAFLTWVLCESALMETVFVSLRFDTEIGLALPTCPKIMAWIVLILASHPEHIVLGPIGSSRDRCSEMPFHISQNECLENLQEIAQQSHYTQPMGRSVKIKCQPGRLNRPNGKANGQTIETT